jgi:hypothetical protein
MPRVKPQVAASREIACRGRVVVVRDFTGVPLVRVVWDADDGAVYITDEDGYRCLTEGDDTISAVGFPRRDVFAYDSAAQDVLATDPVDWSKLERWTGKHEPDGGLN